MQPPCTAWDITLCGSNLTQSMKRQSKQPESNRQQLQHHCTYVVLSSMCWSLKTASSTLAEVEPDAGVNLRIKEHRQRTGSTWTTKHGFVREVMRKRNCSAFEEDLITVQYMQEKGLNNVRGDSYCNDTLKDYQVRSIRDQICTATGRCFKCLKAGHFRKECVNSWAPLASAL